jgi:propionyl-CoA synthetase
VIAEHKAWRLFTAPTAFRAIKREDPDGELLKKYDLRTSARCSWRASAATADRRMGAAQLKVPVIDHWWQTETGWAIAATARARADAGEAGSPSVPCRAGTSRVLDEHGHRCHRARSARWPASCRCRRERFPTLWNADERYRQSYMSEFPGYYKTGDAGFVDEDGYVYVMARTDDVINVAGHRLSTGADGRGAGAHPDVAECAVIGVADDLKGQVPLGLPGAEGGRQPAGREIVAEVVQMVRDRIGPVAAFKSALVVQRLPKTRSGKILRGTMQKIADSQPWTLPATIEDPAVLDEIKDGLKVAGFANK